MTMAQIGMRPLLIVGVVSGERSRYDGVSVVALVGGVRDERHGDREEAEGAGAERRPQSGGVEYRESLVIQLDNSTLIVRRLQYGSLLLMRRCGGIN